MFLLLVVAGKRDDAAGDRPRHAGTRREPRRVGADARRPGACVADGRGRILRWSSPVLHFRHAATVDTEIRGRPIAAGDKVVVWYVSANFDEEVFEDPMRFDAGR